MSYPYGPEPYLAFGTVEGDVDAVSTACRTEPNRLDRLAASAERRAALATDEMRFAHSLSEAQRAGLALDFALDAAGVDEPERFLQDLFSLMEDKVAGGINDRARGNEERLAAGLFGDKGQSHSSLSRSGQ